MYVCILYELKTNRGFSFPSKHVAFKCARHVPKCIFIHAYTYIHTYVHTCIHIQYYSSKFFHSEQASKVPRCTHSSIYINLCIPAYVSKVSLGKVCHTHTYTYIHNCTFPTHTQKHISIYLHTGRHDWFYYTSTKCAIPDDITCIHTQQRISKLWMGRRARR